MNSQPSVGRIVHYKLRASDVESINKRRKDYSDNDKTNWPMGAQAHVGNQVAEGEVYPMVITRVWPEDTHGVNGQVLLDGNDLFWATSVKEGNESGEWNWPPRV